MPFKIIRADITKVKADAIVNTANPKPIVGGGTDSAIYEAAGLEKLLAERAKIGDIAPGQAACTRAFRLHAKYIIHTVGPVWTGGHSGENQTLRACYKNSLELALRLNAESVAFPLISTGVYGFPKSDALSIALSEIQSFLLKNDMTVILAVFDPRSVELSEKLVGGIERYIDEHAVRLASAKEYRGNVPRTVQGGFYPAPEAQGNRRFAPLAGRFNRAKDDVPRQSARYVPEDEIEDGTACDEAEYSAEADYDDGLYAPTSAPEDESAQYGSDAPDKPLAPEALGASASVAFKDIEGRSLDELLLKPGDTFQQRLFKLIDSSGLDDVSVYKKANIDRKLFSRIRCKKDYRPTKRTAVAFAIALKLDMAAMTDLLSRAGLALSPGSTFDLIIAYFVTNGIYDIFEINAALFKYGQPILGE